MSYQQFEAHYIKRLEDRIAELERQLEAAGEFHLNDCDEQTAALRQERDEAREHGLRLIYLLENWRRRTGSECPICQHPAWMIAFHEPTCEVMAIRKWDERWSDDYPDSVDPLATKED